VEQAITGRIVDGEPRVVIGIGVPRSDIVIGARDLAVVASAITDAKDRVRTTQEMARRKSGLRVRVCAEPLADGTTRLVFVRTVRGAPISSWVMLDAAMIEALHRAMAWLAGEAAR